MGDTRRFPRASSAADASLIKLGSEKAVPINDSPNGISESTKTESEFH